MTLHSVAMQQALDQLQAMREAVRPEATPSVGKLHGPSTQMLAPGSQAPAVQQPSFLDTIRSAIDSVNQQQSLSSNLQTAYARGEDVSLTDVAIAMQKSSVAFEATVQVRNKMLEAYKEIMSMTV
jgi:flagellar hook-basal body complex protein FliE